MFHQLLKLIDRSPSSQARGKRTPRKNVKHGKADVSKDQVQASFESGGSPNLPDPVPEKSEDADSDEGCHFFPFTPCVLRK